MKPRFWLNLTVLILLGAAGLLVILLEDFGTSLPIWTALIGWLVSARANGQSRPA